jgi:hypothetical protein
MSSPADRQSAALLSSLNSQREHILGILEGLSEQELRRPVLPSGWTCLGLVQHLARDVEECWFRRVVAGEPIEDDKDEADAWQVSPEVPAETVFSDYRRQIERADAIIAVTPCRPCFRPRRWSASELSMLEGVRSHRVRTKRHKADA